MQVMKRLSRTLSPRRARPKPEKDGGNKSAPSTPRERETLPSVSQSAPNTPRDIEEGAQQLPLVQPVAVASQSFAASIPDSTAAPSNLLPPAKLPPPAKVTLPPPAPKSKVTDTSRTPLLDDSATRAAPRSGYQPETRALREQMAAILYPQRKDYEERIAALVALEHSLDINAPPKLQCWWGRTPDVEHEPESDEHATSVEPADSPMAKSALRVEAAFRGHLTRKRLLDIHCCQ